MSKIFKCIFSVSAAVLLALSAACGETGSGGGKIKVVCTVYPFYDWTVNIAGSSAEVDLIVSGGTDMHSYQPSAEDVIKIADCDLLIYGGGASDAWVTEAVAQNENPGRTVINLLELLGSLAAEEEHTEGMQTDGHDHDEQEEYDEHIWLSLKNASFLTGKIAEALSEKDGENAGTYSSNSAEYKNELDALDNKYADMVSKSENKTLVFADRFPFLYLTRDYGLSYYAAFPGCSAETEASFETVMFLSGKIDELGLKYIMTTESPVAGIAETVRDNTADKNAEILALDSMQSLTAKDGQDYISVMEKNLEVLEKALD